MSLFVAYAPPGVYVDTFEDNNTPLILAGVRIPAFVGTSAETLELNGFEIIRGSSAVSDIRVIGEDISDQVDGITRVFTVQHSPIVDGSGTAHTTNDPNSVIVTIDGVSANVIEVIGATGEITLSQIPVLGASVQVSYWFSRLDTKILNDDVSNQADGVNKIFKVNHPRIVSGNNGGITTTDPALVSVTVNSLVVPVKAVDGGSGLITLVNAPTAGATVLATYYTNTWQDTFDYLPQNINISNINSVGNAPGRQDYFLGTDYVLESGNKVQWGTSFAINAGNTLGGTVFDNTQTSAQLRDNKLYARKLTATADPKAFLLEQLPTDGTGVDFVTDDTTLLSVFVGPSVAAAILAGPVNVDTLNGLTKKVVLQSAPGLGDNVYASYYYNLISDESYTLAVTGAGQYTVTSSVFGALFNAYLNRAASVVASGGFTGVVRFPNDINNIDPGNTTHEYGDVQTLPNNSVAETVTLTFTSATAYTVTSSVLTGSGSDLASNTGVLDQTYVDAITGLRFTLATPNTYAYTAGDTLQLVVTPTFLVGASAPKVSIPGIQLIVTNTTGMANGNTCLVNTYNKSGNEPTVGDSYYVSLTYLKTNFTPTVYTKFTDVVQSFGDVDDISNKLTVAANLAFLNGASAVALFQVLTDNSKVNAPDSAYFAALDSLENPMPGSIIPSVIVPLTTSQPVIQYLNKHVTKVSSSRYAQERTGMFGFPVGTTPEYAQLFVKGIKNERMLAVYPDGAVITVQDALGNSVETTVDGSFVAAALAGLACNNNFDVATPLTRKSLVGFTRMFRRLDAVQMNQSATAGITIMTENFSSIQVRHAVTTDPSTVLTREPSIVFIKDEVQRQTRSTLDKFIATKFVATRLTDIEFSLTNMFKQLVQGEIVTAFKNVEAVADTNDPTIARVTALYSPVFPLNWIKVDYTIRTSV